MCGSSAEFCNGRAFGVRACVVCVWCVRVWCVCGVCVWCVFVCVCGVCVALRRKNCTIREYTQTEGPEIRHDFGNG